MHTNNHFPKATMAHHYVVTAHKPTAVNACVTGEFFFHYLQILLMYLRIILLLLTLNN